MKITFYLFWFVVIIMVSCDDSENNSKAPYEGTYINLANLGTVQDSAQGILILGKDSYSFEIKNKSDIILTGDKGSMTLTGDDLTLSKKSEFRPDIQGWFTLTSPITVTYVSSFSGETLIITRPDNPTDKKTGTYFKKPLK